MSSTVRSFLGVVSIAGLAAVAAVAVAVPAQAVPERFADAGTIVWCEGEGGYLEAYDTTQGGVYWTAVVSTGDGAASAFGEDALLVGDRLQGTFEAVDDESGEPVGELTIDGTMSWGETEVVSGWDVDPDGFRYRSEGTRIPLTGSVTLSLGSVETTLACGGWEIDLETFRLNRAPAADKFSGWVQDGFELDGGAGYVGFYGDRRTELGVFLDLVDPVNPELVSAFAGERFQVRNGQIEGTLILRDPDTFEVVGAGGVSGTLTETGREQIIEAGKGYRWVTTLVHYDVALTITTSEGEWSGTWPATYQSLRTRETYPPKAL